MNKVIITGNLTKDVELTRTNNDKVFTSFSLAVKGRTKEETDFIPVIVWGASAEYLTKYASKGTKVGVVGRIQVRDYEKDGVKKYVTEVVAEDVEIYSFTKDSGKATEKEPIHPELTPLSDDESLPF